LLLSRFGQRFLRQLYTFHEIVQLGGARRQLGLRA
jgi:hypothetical protein